MIHYPSNLILFVNIANPYDSVVVNADKQIDEEGFLTRFLHGAQFECVLQTMGTPTETDLVHSTFREYCDRTVGQVTLTPDYQTLTYGPAKFRRYAPWTDEPMPAR